jgi:6-pyruvoyltetrahydropterin/6-carboxytetrahydropterin synthase
VHVSGSLDPELRWIFDSGDLAALWRERVHEVIDHRYLNAVEGLENPTTEVLADWLWRRLAPSLPPEVSVSLIEIREGATGMCRRRFTGALDPQDRTESKVGPA